MSRNEKEIENTILSYLEAKGFDCWKIQRTGIYDPTLKKFRCSKSRFHKKGLADIQFLCPALINGCRICLTIYIEVKDPNGRQSEHQIEFEKMLKRNDGYYFIACSIGEIDIILDSINRDIQNINNAKKS